VKNHVELRGNVDCILCVPIDIAVDRSQCCEYPGGAYGAGQKSLEHDATRAESADGQRAQRYSVHFVPGR